jgi:hypothetical protein
VVRKLLWYSEVPDTMQNRIHALRHQFLVLQRSNRNRRLRPQLWDRALWVWLSRLWPSWRSALVIVKPETVIAWHRKGFRLYWGAKVGLGMAAHVCPTQSETSSGK